MAKALGQFSITRAGEDYLISIEDGEGETTEFTADFDQLDLITEAIEDALDSDDDDAMTVDEEDADEVEEEEE